MSTLIEKIFKNFGYYFYTPKIDTFGGYIYYLIWLKKIKKKISKKKIIITQIFDPHSKHYYKSSFNPPFRYKLSLYNDLNFSEKLLSLIFSIYVFLNSIIYYLIFFRRFKKFFCLSLGYTNRLKDNLSYFNISTPEDLYKEDCDYNFLNLEKINKENNHIVFCVKDLNYLKYKKITEISCANIKKYKSALDRLVLNNKVIRVGDPSNEVFKYSNLENFVDHTKDKKYFELMISSFFKSKFFFGTGGSQSYLGILSKSERYISNSIDFCGLETSFSKKNFCIFKSIFYKKKNKILSLTEIFEDGHFFKIFENPENYIFIENDENEIDNLAKILVTNDKQQHIDEDLIKKFNQIRKQSFIKFKLNEKDEYFKLVTNCEINIPKFFIQNTLNYGKYLEEKTRKFLSND